MPYTGFKIGG